MAPDIHAYYNNKEISIFHTDISSVYNLQRLWEKLSYPLACLIQSTNQRIDINLNNIDFIVWEEKPN